MRATRTTRPRSPPRWRPSSTGSCPPARRNPGRRRPPTDGSAACWVVAPRLSRRPRVGRGAFTTGPAAVHRSREPPLSPSDTGTKPSLGIVDPAVGAAEATAPDIRPPDDAVLSRPTHGGLHVPLGRLARRPPALHPVPPRPDTGPAHREGDARRGRRLPARRGPAPVRAPDRRAPGGAAGRPADPVPEHRPRPRARRRCAGRGGGRGPGRPLRRADLVEPRRRSRRLDRGGQGAAAGPAPV